MSRHATIRLFQPTGARKRMTPIITPCSIYGDIRHTCSFRGHCFYLNGFHFSYVCRSASPCGALPYLCFHAEYNSEFKVYSLGVDEHAGMGYSLAFAQKNLHSSRWSVVFFCASAEHPFSPVVPQGQRANKLQTAIIRIKKNIAL